MKRLLSRSRAASERATLLLVDEGNRAAVAAMQILGSGEKKLPQPVLLVGPSDSGKSRLLRELMHRRETSGARVRNGTARQWGRRVAAAIHAGNINELAADLLAADLLVVDEVHRLAGAPSTAHLLTRLIAERTEAGRPTVLASRHAPRDIRGASPKSASLMLGGLILFVARPGAGMRRRFLHRLSGGALAADAADHLCTTTPGGLGALQKAYEAWRERAGAITRGEPMPAAPLRASLERIAVAVGLELGVAPDQILGRRRTASLLRARTAWLVLARRFGWSAEELCGAFDGRGRLAVVRFEASAPERIRGDAALAHSIQILWERLARERAAGANGA